MTDLAGRVAFVTGAARGQGRAHALALARAGADVAVCDIGADIATVPYALGTAEELAETARLVEGLGRRCVATVADVRETRQIEGAVGEAVERLGGLDIVVANAGVCGFGAFWEITDEMWDDMIATDLTGAFKTMRAAVPHMLERGYGRIVATSSMGGRAGNRNLAHYVAAKWGVIGLVKTLALEVARRGITVNAVCPATVDTPMVHNAAMYSLFCPGLDEPTRDDVRPIYEGMNPMQLPWLAPEDVAAAVLYLVSEEAGHVSGTALEVSAANSAKSL